MVATIRRALWRGLCVDRPIYPSPGGLTLSYYTTKKESYIGLYCTEKESYIGLYLPQPCSV